MHQLHLVVKGQLTRLESHFSEVATLMNVWRGVQTAVKIYREWVVRYGTERANVACKSLPPRAIAGRWGAIWEPLGVQLCRVSIGLLEGHPGGLGVCPRGCAGCSKVKDASFTLETI
jgi:hypothetical protein